MTYKEKKNWIFVVSAARRILKTGTIPRDFGAATGCLVAVMMQGITYTANVSHVWRDWDYVREYCGFGTTSTQQLHLYGKKKTISLRFCL